MSNVIKFRFSKQLREYRLRTQFLSLFCLQKYGTINQTGGVYHMYEKLIEELKIATGKPDIEIHSELAIPSKEVLDGRLYVVLNKNIAIVKGNENYLVIAGENRGSSLDFESIVNEMFVEC